MNGPAPITAWVAGEAQGGFEGTPRVTFWEFRGEVVVGFCS